MVRSGYVFSNGNARVSELGNYGDQWARTAGNYTSATEARAYNLGVYASVVEPSNGLRNRYVGFSLRCLAD